MSLVKWIRKNNRKIMVFVVIFCMVSFVIGYTGLQIIASIFNPNKQTIAHYGDGKKINRINFGYATNELNVLRMLMSEQLLASQGLSGALLSHLLFPDSQITGDIAVQLKQAVQQGKLQISLDELDAYFNQPTQRPEDLWILLKAEAYRAGYIISHEEAKQILRAVIPQMMQVDAKLVVEQIINKNNITEERIIRAFADLLTVVYYANAVMDNQAVTLNQIKAFLGRSKERLDAEFVEIGAETFVEDETSVSDTDIQNQFESFRQKKPNDPTDDNPFGFGYKLPKRVQVEYMILLMDDVKSQIEPPAAEAMEEFYSNNIERFQTSIPSDPNNPDSEKITQTRSFAEVAPQIRLAIETNKSMKLANMIFNEIKDMTESGLEEITFDEATVDQLQMAAGDYQAVAKKITEKYNVPIIADKTGWLSPDDFREEKVLTALSLQQQNNRISLSDMVFAAMADPQQKVRRIGMPTIRVWQNIGPLKGGYYSMEKEQYFPLMAIVRVIAIQEIMIPETVDIQYDTRGVILFDELKQDDTIFSLKEKVKEDLLLQKAMDTAKARADELASWVEDKGWDEAIASYNEKYVPAGEDPNDPEEYAQAIELDSAKQQTRASQTETAFAKQYIRENPVAAGYMQQRLVMNMLNNRFFEMLPEDSQSTGTIHQVIVFEPGAACYIVKNVTRQPATRADYLENKASTAMQLSMQDMSSLPLVHFSPENILKRMDYEPEEIKQRAVVEEIPIEDIVEE